MNDAYTNELFKENEVDALLPLYENAFGTKFPFRLIKNKFFGDYQKIRASYVTFVNSTKIVSFYGVICQKATLNSEIFYIAQSCDSMTHKEYSGKGLFVNLAGKVYEQLVKEGLDFVYGFPNTAIYPLRIKKLHWKHSENINYYEKTIKTFPFAKAVKKFPVLKSLYVIFLNVLLRKYKSKISSFPNSVIEPNIGGVLHDQAYFDYKNTNDKFVLKINGINFWIKFDGLLWVGDFERCDSNRFFDAFKKLKIIAALTGCSTIAFHYHEGSTNDLLLKQFLKIEESMPYGYLNLTEKNLNWKFKFSAADFDTW